MKQLILPILILTTLLVSCIPKTQYAALETERNYYRNQTLLADSLEDQRAITSYDEVDLTGNDLNQRIRQVETLTATNIALNQSYQSLSERYEELLGQSQQMLSENGTEVSGLQQSLAERTTAVAEREAELRQLEIDLRAREETIARIEGDYAPAGGGSPSAYGTSVAVPQGYGTDVQRTAISTTQATALHLNDIQNSLTQLFLTYPTTAYAIENEGIDQLRVTLSEGILMSDGYTVSPNGQNLLRGIAGILRNQAAAEATIIGHTDTSNPNAKRAYEDSTDKAINVAQQLINFGMSPRKLTIAGRGFFDPVTNAITQSALMANRRTELVINIAE